MDLGAFSISLSVSDLAASKAFYEALGFEAIGGNEDEHWLILRNGASVIGLFHQMFDGNILTFNPGLDQEAGEVPIADDVRAIKQSLEGAGIDIVTAAGTEEPAGPAHIVITDPDGNAIMIDQHR